MIFCSAHCQLAQLAPVWSLVSQCSQCRVPGPLSPPSPPSSLFSPAGLPPTSANGRVTLLSTSSLSDIIINITLNTPLLLTPPLTCCHCPSSWAWWGSWWGQAGFCGRNFKMFELSGWRKMWRLWLRGGDGSVWMGKDLCWLKLEMFYCGL